MNAMIFSTCWLKDISYSSMSQKNFIIDDAMLVYYAEYIDKETKSIIVIAAKKSFLPAINLFN